MRRVTLKNSGSDLLAKEKGEKKLFGFSFVPLMQEDGRTLPDGTHELIVHKVWYGYGSASFYCKEHLYPCIKGIVFIVFSSGTTD